MDLTGANFITQITNYLDVDYYLRVAALCDLSGCCDIPCELLDIAIEHGAREHARSEVAEAALRAAKGYGDVNSY